MDNIVLNEYMPGAALNPVIGAGPLPVYTPSQVDSTSFNDDVAKNHYGMAPTNSKEAKNFRDTFDAVYRGIMPDNFDEVRNGWFDAVCKEEILLKAEPDEDKKKVHKQNLLALGWDPCYPIDQLSADTWAKINKTTITTIMNEYQYANTSIIDICEFVKMVDTTKVIGTHNARSPHKKNLNPIYLTLVSGTKESFTSSAIRWWTKGPFCHACIGFKHTLEDMHSYNTTKFNGLSDEGLDFYKPDETIAVYTIFVEDEDMRDIKRNLDYYIDNRDKTSYSRLNIASIVFNVPLNFEFSMVCSQFVDRILKFAKIDLTHKDSSLVSPNDFWKASKTNKKMYKVYEGKVKDYKPNKIKAAVDRLLHSSRTKTIKEAAQIITEKAIYQVPYTRDEIEMMYGKETLDVMMENPALAWRADTGIEIIYPVYTNKELDRLWENWNAMTPEQKKESDKKAKALFNKTNLRLYYDLKEYIRYKENPLATFMESTAVDEFLFFNKNKPEKEATYFAENWGPRHPVYFVCAADLKDAYIRGQAIARASKSYPATSLMPVEVFDTMDLFKGDTSHNSMVEDAAKHVSKYMDYYKYDPSKHNWEEYPINKRNAAMNAAYLYIVNKLTRQTTRLYVVTGIMPFNVIGNTDLLRERDPVTFIFKSNPIAPGLEEDIRAYAKPFKEFMEKRQTAVTESNIVYTRKNYILDETMSTAERDALPDSVFGIPSLRKYPLTDTEHVRSAIKLFGHCPSGHEKELAANINKAAAKYNIEIKDGSAVAGHINEAVDKLDNCDSMEELYKILWNDFVYGYKTPSGKITENPNDPKANYKTISPQQFAKVKTGICWDFSEYEMEYIKKYFPQYNPQMWYIVHDDGHKVSTHTWVSYTEGGKTKVIEAAFGKMKGVHEYSNVNEMLDAYAEAQCNSDNYILRKVPMVKKYGLSAQQYMDHMNKSGVEVRRVGEYVNRESAIESYDEDIFDSIPLYAVTETKEFPIQFTDDGDLIIKNYKKLDYNQEYQRSHSILKTYATSGQIEGIKYELSKLWFLNTVLMAKIDDPKTSQEDVDEYRKIRAWVLNDFNKYMKVITKAIPRFNFSKYYEDSPFSNVKIKINAGTIKTVGKGIKRLIVNDMLT